jgi:hypothetical protein
LLVVFEHRKPEFFFALEVIIKGALGNVNGIGDFLDAGGVESVQMNELQTLSDDVFPIDFSSHNIPAI